MEESVQQVIMQSIQEIESDTTNNSSNSIPDLDPQLQRVLRELEAAREAKEQMVQRCHELDMQVCTRAFSVDCFCIET